FRRGGETAIKIAAPAGPRGMRGGGRHIAKRLTDLLKTRTIEPALADATTNGPTIRAKLARAHVVMPTLVMIDEQAHRSGLARDEGGIDHQKLGVRYGYAEIEQARVQDVAYVATA